VPLTRKEFLSKHKGKFDQQNLNIAERNKRYSQYVQSFGGRPPPKQNRNTALIRQNNRAKQRTPGQKVKKVRKRMPETTIGFSDCALNYARALIDPWSVVDPPCVPDEFTLPSFKFGARARGSFSSGTLGNGYFLYSPYTVINNGNCGYGTTTSFATSTFGGVGEANTTVVQNDSPFVSTDFASNLKGYRLVGSGLAVRYIGNEMLRGGQMVLYRNNGNLTMPNPYPPSEMLQNKETTTVPVDRDWHYVVWLPTDATDITYVAATQTYYCMMAWISNCGAAQGFEFDVVSWFEVVGTALPNMTPSEFDPLGLAVIKSSVAVAQPPDSPQSNFSRFLETAGAVANASLSFLGTGAKVAMKTATALTNVGLL
jgi:hypothetical protein